jgi:hypothetical protein
MDPEELGRQLNRHHRAENDGLWHSAGGVGS